MRYVNIALWVAWYWWWLSVLTGWLYATVRMTYKRAHARPIEEVSNDRTREQDDRR